MNNIKWIEPIQVARNLNHLLDNDKDWIFLYSGMQIKNITRYSIIAFDTKNIIDNEKDFKKISNNNLNYWFGYISYNYKNSLEKLTLENQEYIQCKEVLFYNFKNIYIFDHIKQNIKIIGKYYPEYFIDNVNFKNPNFDITNFTSNMTKQQYYNNVNHIIDQIKEGNVYEANLTRKFFGNINNKDKNYFNIFDKTTIVSPAPYSAYMKFNKLEIISSSPERFLTLDHNRIINSKPIKGTINRSHDPVIDLQNQNKLLNSEKDKSENLMIVDLMRNDISKIADIGSLNVDDLFTLTSYQHIHHLSSSISAKIQDKYSIIDIINNCFPPGSMTGAPKISAMEICSKLEHYKRGIYSGVLGWIHNNQFDLSVIIRTIIIKENMFEIQAGGAIVLDSIAELEHNEIMYKTKALCDVLNISKNQIESL